MAVLIDTHTVDLHIADLALDLMSFNYWLEPRQWVQLVSSQEWWQLQLLTASSLASENEMDGRYQEISTLERGDIIISEGRYQHKANINIIGRYNNFGGEIS